MRSIQDQDFVNLDAILAVGLTPKMIREGLNHTYEILDMIDERLVVAEKPRLARLIELNNLSSIIGNLVSIGIAQASGGLFVKNNPHKFPDLLAQAAGAVDIEVKVAFAKNFPKGHLPKAGHYLTLRYLLESTQQTDQKQRGEVVWIWEMRLGQLAVEHFRTSNTEGDSGKTATLNRETIQNLKVIFCDLERCPYARTQNTYREYAQLYKDHLDLG